ncbi:hypothetical protein, partial [Sphingobacterium multivorum]|uniref:hypothetical protein n=1 Tax=Sphingobacterium multivorum TaxID=28454 RepID=UPI003DA5B06E
IKGINALKDSCICINIKAQISNYFLSPPQLLYMIHIPPLLSVGQIHFDGSNSSAGLTTALLDISLLPGLGGGLNVVKSNFMNVRCVRN